VDVDKVEILRLIEVRFNEGIQQVIRHSNNFYGKPTVEIDRFDAMGLHCVYVEFPPFNDPALHSINLSANIYDAGILEILITYCCGSVYKKIKVDLKEKISQISFESMLPFECELTVVECMDFLIEISDNPRNFVQYWDCPD
jgi:hypothetical protein